MKTIVFGDIHFGKKTLDRFNEYAFAFIKFLCETAPDDARRVVFLGDWFDNRSHITLDTIHYSSAAINLLQQSFDRIDMIVGNHDMFYRDSRNIHSLEMFRSLDKVFVHDTITKNTDTGELFVPFLIKDEYKKMKRYKATVTYGHFEYAGFLTNQYREMDDHGNNSVDYRPKSSLVLTGHFHKRQVRTFDNTSIVYVGSPFAHDFNDVGDTERGYAILDENMALEFVDWEDGPRFVRVRTDEFLDMHDSLRQQDVVEIIDASESDLEKLSSKLKDAEFNVRIRKKRDEPEHDDTTIETGDVNAIIEKLIASVRSPNEESPITPDKLLEIYRNA